MKRKNLRKGKITENDTAANLIRTKIDSAYALEPNLYTEINEIKNTGAHSKHQLYMNKLLVSGKSYLDIQAAWHSYYLSLPDNEKHEVWREFYSIQNRQNHLLNDSTETQPAAVMSTKGQITEGIKLIPLGVQKSNTTSRLKHKLLNKITADGRLTTKHHVRSILFGIGLAGIFGTITAFTLFNQLFIGPFIKPSINASATPIIGTPIMAAVSPETKIIIPKLNVEAPIVTDVVDNQESTIQKALQNGVVLYPNTGKPGELGNQAVFGHSSNNLFNRGDYKYVFVLLSKMENGDIIYINYLSKQYTYRVINKKIIKPTEVSILSEQPVPSLITLITCDPPGANVNRLVVQAEQISPKPETNKLSSAQQTNQPTTLAGSPESLFKRLLTALFN